MARRRRCRRTKSGRQERVLLRGHGEHPRDGAEDGRPRVAIRLREPRQQRGCARRLEAVRVAYPGRCARRGLLVRRRLRPADPVRTANIPAVPEQEQPAGQASNQSGRIGGPALRTQRSGWRGREPRPSRARGGSPFCGSTARSNRGSTRPGGRARSNRSPDRATGAPDDTYRMTGSPCGAGCPARVSGLPRCENRAAAGGIHPLRVDRVVREALGSVGRRVTPRYAEVHCPTQVERPCRFRIGSSQDSASPSTGTDSAVSVINQSKGTTP